MDAEVVIVGAGLAGLSLGYHLAPHRRVLVVDRGVAGAEASSQNAGMIRELVEDPVDRALAVRSARWLADPGPDWPEARPARVTGALIPLTLDPHHLDDAVAHLRARDVEVLPAPPDVAPAWAQSWRTAWWVPRAQIADPQVMVRGFCRAIESHGGEVRTGVTVRGFLGNSRIEGVATDAGPLTAEVCVIAAGAWSGLLGRLAGVARRLVPLRRSVWRTASHPLANADDPWIWIDDLGLYVRPDGDRFLVCGCDEQPEPEPGPTGPADPQMAAITRQRLVDTIPSIADLELTQGWSGLRTFAPDRRPLLGPDPERPGLWWLAGLGGSGVTCCAAAGEAVARWLRGETTTWLPRRPVDPGRPQLRRFPIRAQGNWAETVLLDVE